MAIHRVSLPQVNGGVFLDYAGMETDIIFSKGMELPGFAAYPLLETEDGRKMLADYMRAFIEVGRSHGAGVIIESPTHGSPIGTARSHWVTHLKTSLL